MLLEAASNAWTVCPKSPATINSAPITPPDALWLRVLRSPHARATFKINDLDAFLADNTDIETILTAADVPGENSFGIYPDLKDQPVFADGLVRYRGEAVLAVVGTKEAVDSSTSPLCRSIGRPKPRSAGFRPRYTKAQHPFTRIRPITS